MCATIIPIKKDYKVHEISGKLLNLFKTTDKLRNIFPVLASFCCLNNGKKIIFYHNIKSDYCYYINAQLNDAYLFFIKNFINEKDIDIEIAFKFLLIAEEIVLVEKNMFELFHHLHWPSSKKGIDYFNFMKKFSGKLREKVFQKKVSLKDACYFYKSFLNNYDRLLSFIPEKLTFSQTNEVIRNISEYSRREKKNINDIIKLFSNIDIDKILSFSYDLRYPLYSKYLDVFDSYMKKLNIPKGAKIIFDKTFEKEDFSIEIKFNNILSFLNKIKMIKESLEHFISNDDYLDFFDHNKLFKTNEKK